jgi:hypothetical protein
MHIERKVKKATMVGACARIVTQANQQVTLVSIDQLTPYKGNARTHSKKQIEQIAASIRKFGFNNPVLVADNGQIIAGHGRVEAAKLLGLGAVPTLRSPISLPRSNVPTSWPITNSPRRLDGIASYSPSNFKG